MGSEPRPRPRANLLWLEFCVLFLALPWGLYLGRSATRFLVLPIILGVALGCGIVLWRDPGFDRRRWLGWPGWAPLWGVVVRTLLGGPFLVLGVSLWAPEGLFQFPAKAPGIWVVVMLLYPVLSAYPQEVIYRGFIHHRYRDLFPTPLSRILASAFAFGWGHVMLGRWEAVALSALAGALFARTYERSGTLLAPAIEHAIWGDLAFTLGLGRLFYGGWSA